MAASLRESLLSFSKSFSPSTTKSPASQSESPGLFPSIDHLVSNTNVPNATSQTPIPLSIALSTLIPVFLLLIYSLYIIHRIRQYYPFAVINGYFRTCICVSRNGKQIWSRRGRRRRGRGNGGYMPINANLNNSDDGVEHDEWSESACANHDYEGIELDDLQGVDIEWKRIQHGYHKRGYQLIDMSSSDSDTDSDTASIFRLAGVDEGFDISNQDQNREQMDQVHWQTQGHNHKPPPAQEGLAEFDLSKYFDPRTSRLRENILLAPGTEIGAGEEDKYEEREKGEGITAQIHMSVDWVVAKFIGWLEG